METRNDILIGMMNEAGKYWKLQAVDVCCFLFQITNSNKKKKNQSQTLIQLIQI